MENLVKKVLKKLRNLRLEKNLTQEQVAQKINIKPLQYSRYERGERQVPIEFIISLADFYNLSLDELFDRDDRIF